ncbi:MAG: AIR synthase-related protein [Lachnospiraceae bacterium]|nr:AIR synthase-related protein [Lachnospiraceae bacterium]
MKREVSVKGSVLMTGSAALSFAERICLNEGGDMRERFPSFFRARRDEPSVNGEAPFLAELGENCRRLSEAAAIADLEGALFVKEIGERGLLSCLWDMGEELGCGMEIEMKKIPIRQEAVEICELMRADPYMEESRGALLLAVPDSAKTLWALSRAGIRAEMIGVITDSPARTIIYPGHTRYLDKPR